MNSWLNKQSVDVLPKSTLGKAIGYSLNNWMFSNTPKGATSSAIIYSIVETAKENRLIPFEYMKHLLEKLPGIDTDDAHQVARLMP